MLLGLVRRDWGVRMTTDQVRAIVKPNPLDYGLACDPPCSAIKLRVEDGAPASKGFCGASKTIDLARERARNDDEG